MTPKTKKAEREEFVKAAMLYCELLEGESPPKEGFDARYFRASALQAGMLKAYRAMKEAKE